MHLLRFHADCTHLLKLDKQLKHLNPPFINKITNPLPLQLPNTSQVYRNHYNVGAPAFQRSQY